jgi:hypothetical protein
MPVLKNFFYIQRLLIPIFNKNYHIVNNKQLQKYIFNAYYSENFVFQGFLLTLGKFNHHRIYFIFQ